MISNTTGIVLAGGASRRFGSNKALAEWNSARHGSKKLVDAVADVLTPLFPFVLILSKKTEDFKHLTGPTTQVAADLFEETHPLGGIYSALSYSKTEKAFICACDLPFLQPELIRTLCVESDGFDATIPIWDKIPQPHCGVYSKNCMDAIKKMIKGNQFKMQDLFGLVRTRFLGEDKIRPIDPSGLSFLDIDTQGDYAKAKDIMNKGVLTHAG